MQLNIFQYEVYLFKLRKFQEIYRNFPILPRMRDYIEIIDLIELENFGNRFPGSDVNSLKKLS